MGLIIAPNGRFAYAPNEGDNDEANISGYTIDSTRGALTPVTGSPFKDGKEGSNPTPGAVDFTGKFAYFPNNSTGNVSAYAIAASGALRKVKGRRLTRARTPLVWPYAALRPANAFRQHCN